MIDLSQNIAIAQIIHQHDDEIWLRLRGRGNRACDAQQAGQVQAGEQSAEAWHWGRITTRDEFPSLILSPPSESTPF